jgi:hypothetical protein
LNTRKVKKAYRLNQWTEIIRKCRSSGQTVVVFCNEQNLNPQSYYYWLRLVREAACEALPAIANEKNMIVPLTLGESAACPSKAAVNTKITLHYGEFSLNLDENTSSSFIEDTIRTLMNLQGKSSC